MAMSLEYVTRLIILLVVAGVVIGIVTSVDIIPPPDPDPSDTQFVNVSISDKDAQAREIAKLVAGCYDEYWKDADRKMCFAVRNQHNWKDIDAQIKSNLNSELKNETTVLDSYKGKSSAYIYYEVKGGTSGIEYPEIIVK